MVEGLGFGGMTARAFWAFGFLGLRAFRVEGEASGVMGLGNFGVWGLRLSVT